MVRESKIIIAQGIKLDNDYKNVLSYTQQQMLDLVSSNDHKLAMATNYSFIRQERNIIQVGFQYSTVCNANYMAFQNPDYNNRWFFAFIRDVQYENDKTVNIIFDIDVWSTFYGDLSLMKCFVEREHVNDDTIGLHTVPENIDAGEMIAIDEWNLPDLTDYYYVGVLTDWLPVSGPSNSGKQFDGITVYNQGVFGHQLVVFSLSGSPTTPSTTPDLYNLAKFINITNIDGHIEDIKDMFIIPGAGVDATGFIPSGQVHRQNLPGTVPVYDETTYFNLVSPTFIQEQFDMQIDKIKSFDNLNIHNNKCFCFPYNYLLVTNNNGNQNIYRYENFSDEDYATFDIELALSIGMSGRCVPKNYKGVAINDDESIALGKYPTCNWTSDSFTNWLTQQAINLPTKFLTLGAGIGASPFASDTASEGVAKASLIGVAGGISLVNEFRNEALKPNIEGGGNTGDVLFSSNRNGIFFYCMRSKDEYIKIVDKYFDRFGYKIQQTKTPNVTGRTYWNYIKIGGNDRFASGNIQTKFLDTINEIAQKGTTIWHNHANIGNFDLNNTIV